MGAYVGGATHGLAANSIDEHKDKAEEERQTGSCIGSGKCLANGGRWFFLLASSRVELATSVATAARKSVVYHNGI